MRSIKKRRGERPAKQLESFIEIEDDDLDLDAAEAHIDGVVGSVLRTNRLISSD